MPLRNSVHLQNCGLKSATKTSGMKQCVITGMTMTGSKTYECRKMHLIISVKNFPPFISKEDTDFRKCVPVKVRVAVTLYFLSGCSDYRTIANLFGLGRSTVCGIVYNVCKEFVSNMIRKYIYLPSRNETKNIMAEFEEISGFPQAVGAIDGCHIRIKEPNENPEDYVNRKDYHILLFYKAWWTANIYLEIFLQVGQANHMMPGFLKILLYSKSARTEPFCP